MSASSLSMAAASSSLSNLYSHNSLTHCFIPTHHHFPSLSKPPKSLKLKAQNPTPLHLYLLSYSHPRRFSSAFGSLQVTEDSQDDPQTETEPETESESESGAEEESQPELKGAESSSNEGRLYVGNLPYSMTSTQLAEVFEEVGGVVSAEIVYDRVTDRSRGFGFVTMGSVQDAKAAIRLFDANGGRTVKVNFPEVPRGGERAVMGPKIRSSYQGFVDSPYKVYAGNLGWRLTSQGLRDAFADQPGLLNAKVIYERDTGRSRGFGFVSFGTAEDLQSALYAMNGVEVEGRPLRLNVAAERAPSPLPPVVESTGNSLDSSELLSSIST